MNSQQPLISIITPFLNEEMFIEEMIRSVLEQTLEDWELILADDGSADKSTEIAKKYAVAYPGKIRYYDHPGHENLGSSASRNMAVQKARGEFVAFLDGDDIFQPDYLENQMSKIRRTGASMVCEATMYWYSWESTDTAGGRPRKDTIVPVGVPQDRLYQPGELNHLLYPLNKNAAAPCMCGIIAYRDALLKHGEFEEAFRRNYTDQVFLSKMYYHDSIYISSSCNNYYRQRNDSMMANIRDVKAYDKVRLQFLEWFELYIKNSGNSDQELRKLIKRNLLPYRHPIYYAAVHEYPRRIFNKARRMAGVK